LKLQVGVLEILASLQPALKSRALSKRAPFADLVAIVNAVFVEPSLRLVNASS